MPSLPRPAAFLSRIRHYPCAGLLLALVALFAQIAAATPIPPAAPGQPTTVMGVALPVCGLSRHTDPPAPAGDRHGHLHSCGGCLCCQVPAMLTAAAPRAPLPAGIVYAALVLLPPPAAPPARLAARPPPRAPPGVVSH